MLQRSATHKLIKLLKRHARRSLRLKVEGFPRPYFCSLLLRDVRWFNTWSSSGSIFGRKSDHTRNVFCDIRVGTHRYDQTVHGGLLDNDEDLESVGYSSVPVDDRNHDGLNIALWRLTETKFREVLSDYNLKEASGVSTVDLNRKFHSFVKVRPVHSLGYARQESVDEEAWVTFCKKASQWISELPHLSSNTVHFESTVETKVFVSTEGSVVVQPHQVFTLGAVLKRMTPEGSTVEQELIYNCASQKELPKMKDFRKEIRRKHAQLIKLAHARKIHSFSGPVLLYPIPAGLLFHEAVGHRLEGSRLLSTGEGQTFKGQVGKRVLNVDLSIRDNPKLRRFNGHKCIGAYDYDDEGTPSKNTQLMENGILKGFLSTRASLSEKNKNFVPTGHARNSSFQRPISRMGVTIIKGKGGATLDELRARLIKEIKRQEKPFGMIVYETSGGETETTRYDFQAFSGEISYATLIYPNGKEVVVKGVNFVGTPLQALNNVIAVGKDLEIDNGFCGAESGFIPVTTISPAVLLSNLELQAKDEELVTQYLLPRP
jgi:predicted Zn-dependent protease